MHLELKAERIMEGASKAAQSLYQKATLSMEFFVPTQLLKGTWGVIDDSNACSGAVKSGSSSGLEPTKGEGITVFAKRSQYFVCCQ